MHPALEQSGPGNPAVLTTGELRVDIEKKLVYIREEHIPVTATEFRILCTLISQVGVVMRRGELLSAICEDRTHATSRSLDVHMSRLRAKLQSYGGCIQTLKGIGYRFKPTIE